MCKSKFKSATLFHGPDSRARNGDDVFVGKQCADPTAPHNNRVRTLTGKEIELDIESDYKVRREPSLYRLGQTSSSSS